MANSKNKRSSENDSWMAEKNGLDGNPEDWMREKEQSMQDILDEKSGVSKQGPINRPVIIGLVSLLFLGVAVVLIVALAGKAPPPPPQVDPKAEATQTATAADVAVKTLLDEALVLTSQCSPNSKIACSTYITATAKLEQAYKLKSTSTDIAARLKQAYQGYADQLFRTANSASTFELGLRQVRKALTSFPEDKDLQDLEKKANFYQQGLAKMEIQRYDEAAGRFKSVYTMDKVFYQVGNKYYESLLKLADLIAPNGQGSENQLGEAKFYLNEALS